MSALPQMHLFRYPFPSELIADGGKRTLRLATFRKGWDASPFSFEGRLTNPRRTAEFLRAVTTITIKHTKTKHGGLLLEIRGVVDEMIGAWESADVSVTTIA